MVLRTERDDINLAADRDPTELGWGNSQRTCSGPEKRLGIKADVCARIQKNMLRGRVTGGTHQLLVHINYEI